MSELKKPQTRSEYYAKKDFSNPRVFLGELLSALGTSSRYLVRNNDPYKIRELALKEFSRSDFSNAGEYVADLVMIVEHYQELAEHYLSELTYIGSVVDEHGYVVSHQGYDDLDEQLASALGKLDNGGK